MAVDLRQWAGRLRIAASGWSLALAVGLATAAAAEPTDDRVAAAGRGDVVAVDDFGKTPLMGAAEVGHADVVRVLLAAGANVNARTKNGANALTWATDAKVRALLLQAGARP